LPVVLLLLLPLAVLLLLLPLAVPLRGGPVVQSKLCHDASR